MPFCPNCGKQNQDDVSFCKYCGKALPQKSSSLPVIQPIIQANPSSQETSAKKGRISNNGKKALITGILIVGLIIIVLLIYYPNIFPWKW
jgi:uncharacterized membrane protein YvbJ